MDVFTNSQLTTKEAVRHLDHPSFQFAIPPHELCFESVISALPEPILILDSCRRLIFVNPAFEALLDLNFPPRLGTNLSDYFDTATTAQIEAVIDELETMPRRLIPAEITLGADQELRHLSVQLQRIKDNCGEAVILGRFSDQSAHQRDKQAVKRLHHESEEIRLRLETFTQAESEWLWEMDRDLRFSYLSPNAAEQNLVGKTRREILAPESVTPEIERHLRLMEEHQPFRNFVFRRIDRSDGSEVWVSTSGQPIFDKEEKFQGYRGTAHYVTDQILRERELIAATEAALNADKAKSEFLANMSHELRTPLNAVIGFSELTQMNLDPEVHPTEHAYMDHVADSGRHLVSLIDDLLDLSRIESGTVELSKASFSLKPLMDSAMIMLCPAAKVRNVALRLDLPDREIRLIGDQRAIKQIILNLGSNALKNTSAGGEVSLIATLNASGGLEIGVKDNGIGISEDELNSIMLPFGRTEEAKRTAQPGAGLGLCISNALAELQGGYLKIHSELGQGTFAKLVLPDVEGSLV